MPFDTNLPNVAVRDIEVYLPTNKLVAATYGRGIWTTNLPAPLSTSTFDQANVLVYPNPFQDELTVTSANEIPGAIKIYDFSGKLILEQSSFKSNENQINLQSLSSGLYLMKITLADKTISRKIIKK